MTRNQSRSALVGLFLAATIGGFCAPIFRLPNNASLQFRPGNVGIYAGSGAPTLTAPIGSVYLRKDGGAGTSLYVNETGTSTWQTLQTTGALITVSQGGTGVATLASNGVLYGNGAGVVQVTAQGPANSVLTANAGAPSFSATPTLTSLTAQFNQAADSTQTLAGSAALSMTSTHAGKSFYPVAGSGGAVTGITLPSGTTTGQMISIEGTSNTNTVQFSVNGATNIISQKNVTTRTLALADLWTLIWDGTNWEEDGFTLASSAADPYQVAEGGTGAQTFTAHGVLLGEGTSAITPTAVGASGTVLIGNTGADPTFSTDPVVRRVFATGGTLPTAVALTGWGGSAVASFAAGSDDTRGQLIITTNAADTPSANPTAQVTYKDGTFTTVPSCVASYDSTSTGPNATPGIGTCMTTSTATTFTITYNGTPTATNSKTYKFNYINLG